MYMYIYYTYKHIHITNIFSVLKLDHQNNRSDNQLVNPKNFFELLDKFQKDALHLF